MDRIVGFDGLGGGRDDFPTSVLEAHLVKAGTIKPAWKAGGDALSGDDEGNDRRDTRNSKIRHGFSRRRADASDEESSDFSD